jgi:phage-related protein
VHFLWYTVLYKVQDDGGPETEEDPADLLFRTITGSEPVREWLRGLDDVERKEIGKDLLRAQWRWPVGMPLCLVALHGFVKKTRTTPGEDRALARKRQKELEE